MFAASLPAAGAVTITTPFLPPGVLGFSYTTTLAAKGGATNTYTWKLASGTLAGTGLSLSTAGVVSGTPVSRNVATVSITATDQKGTSATKVFRVKVALPVSVTTTALRIGVTGGKYPSTALLASSGLGGNTWSLAAGSFTGTGMSLSSAGVLSGTPASAGTISFTVKVTDKGSHSATQALSIVVKKALAINAAIPSRIVTGSIFNASLISTGGSGANVFSISTGNLPAGLTLNSANGKISGRPTTAGTFPFTVQVTDSYADVATKPFSVVVGPPLLSDGSPVIDPPTLNDSVQGSPYSQQLTVSNLPGTITWSVLSGGDGLPAGLSLNPSTGLLSGTPTTSPAPFSFTVRASSSIEGDGPVDQSYTLNVLPPIDFSPTSVPLPDGTPGAFYFASIQAQGGYCCSYAYSITSPPITFPPGLTMDASGFISGTPILRTGDPTSYTFQVTATDSNSDFGTANFTIKLDPTTLQLTSDGIADGSLNIPFFYPLTAVGGTGATYTYTITAGALPAGVVLNSNGIFSGTPTEFSNSSTYDFDVKVTDSEGNMAFSSFSLFVDEGGLIDVRFTGSDAPFFFGPAVLGYEGNSWNQVSTNFVQNQQLTDERSTTTGVLFSLGGPNIQVDLGDSSGAFCTRETAFCNLFRGFFVNSSPYTASMAFRGLAPGSSWDFYFLTQWTFPTQLSLSINGGAFVTSSVEDGTDSVLVAGKNYLLVTGTADSGGNLLISFQASPSGSPFINGIQLTPHVSPLTITANLPSALVGSPYSGSVVANGGSGVNDSISISSGSLPPGLFLDESGSGSINGTPTAAGDYPAVYSVTDSLGYKSTQSISIHIDAAPALSIDTTFLPNAIATVAYNQTLSASGGFPPYTWSVAEGSPLLPPNLILDGNSGVISGTTTGASSSLVTFQVTDNNGTSVQKSLTVTSTVNAISLDTTSIPNGTLRIPYFKQLVATFGTGVNRTFSIVSGALPAGMTLGSSSGIISGTPTVSGSFSVNIQVTDTGGTVSNQTYNFSIRPFGTINTRWQGGATSPYTGPGVIGAPGDVWNLENAASGSNSLVDSAGQPVPATISWSGDSAYNSNNSNGFCTPTPNQYCQLMNGYLMRLDGATATISFNGLPGNASWDLFIYTQLDASTPGRRLSVTLNGSTTVTTTTDNSATDSTFILNKNYLVATANSNVDGALGISFHGIGTGSAEGDVNAIQLRPHVAPLTITQTTVPGGVLNAAYSANLSATGGVGGAQVWSVTSGSLPNGVTLTAATGTLSGTTTAAGTFGFTVQVVDGQNNTATQAFSIPVVAPLSITTTSLPAGLTGVAYSQTLTSTGGTGGNIWTITSGVLPSGINLNQTTGVLSGTTSATANVSLTIQVTDSGSNTDTKNLNFRIYAPVSIVTESVPNSTVAFPYFTQLVAAGGSGLNTAFTVTSGALPAGVTLAASTGTISGSPTVAGSSSFTIQLTDSTGTTASKAYTLAVRAFGTLNTRWQADPPDAFNGPAVIGLASDSWNLFNTASGSGALSDSAGQATPAGVSWTAISAWNSGNQNAFCSPTPNQFCPLMNGYLATGNGDIRNVTFSGLTPNASWDIYLYQQLDAGTGRQISITVNGATTTQTTVPNDPADSTFILNKNYLVTTVATDSSGNLSIDYHGVGPNPEADINGIQLRPHLASLSISQTSVAAGVQGALYAQQLSSTGGTATGLVWSISAGTLPTGITLSAGGQLAGTPSVNGNFNFTVQVTDSANDTATQAFSLTIFPPVSISTSSLAAGVQGASYSKTLAATGGLGGYTWTIFSGALPSGLTLDPPTGTISGTPTVSGTVTPTFKAMDTAGNFATQTLSLTIALPLTITQITLPPGAIGQPYSQTIASQGGVGGNIWSIIGGALQSGLSLSAAGVIGGTPSSSGTANVTFQFADSDGNKVSKAISLQINPALSITTTTLASAVSGVSYTQTISATGGLGSYLFSVTSGSVPGGFVLSSAGVLSGTTSVAGPYSFTVGVTDSGTGTASQALSLAVVAPVTVTTSTLPSAVQGVNYTTTLAASGGQTGGYTWSVSTGTLPAGLVLNVASGAISGTPTTPGAPVSFTVKATDTLGNFGTANLTLQVLPQATITTTTLPTGLQGVSYSQTIAASGGFGGYTFTVSSGTLPAGLNLSAGGVLSGTPTASGQSSFTVLVTDSSTSQATQAYVLNINGQVTIVTSSLPNATQGTNYSQTLSGAGGIGALTWSFASDTTATQAGLSINSSTGVLSGTPNTFGTLTVSVRLQDTESNFVTKTLNLLIGEQTPESYGIVVSDKAAGQIVRMSSDGSNPLTICATACHAGDIAADAQGNIYTHDTSGIYKITPGGVVTTVLARSGGAGGLAVDASGNIVFVDNQSDSIYRVTSADALTTVAAFPVPSADELQDTYVAIDANGNYVVTSDDGGAVKIYRFTPAGGPATLATFPEARSSGVAVTSSGIIEFVNYAGKALVGFDPNGATGNSTTIPIPTSDSVLYGIVIDPANGNFIVTGQSTGTVNRITTGGAATTLVSTQVFEGLSGAAIVPSLQAPSISTVSLPGGLVGNSYGPVTLTATGGSGNFTWTATNLAPGLVLSPGGVISGGLSAVGSFTSKFTVTDTVTGLSASVDLAIVVSSKVVPLSISESASQVSVAIGGAISASFSATGGTPPYTFSATGLPGGVTIGSSGSLSGSTSQPGNFSATISVTDAGGQSANTGFTINVLGISISALPTGLVGTQYSAGVNGLGGLPPYSFSAAGLPAGLSIGGSGAISGTPTAAGTFNVTITVSDSGGARISGTTTITVLAVGAPVTISSGNLPDATVNVSYSQSIAVTGGKAPYTWRVVSGVAPAGMSFGTNGILSGIAIAPGSYTFGAEVKDSAGGTTSTTASITVKPAVLTITSKSPLSSGMNGVEYPSIQMASSGGVTPYTWALTSGVFPAGLTFDSGGTLSGTPTVAGSFSPGFTATDAAGNKATATFALTIRPVSADLILSSGSIAFSITAGADSVPSGQAVTVQSTAIAQQIAYAVQVSPAVSWLTAASGTSTPGTIGVALSNAALALAPGDYSTSIKAVCGTGGCTGNSQNVNVTLSVTAQPPQLKVDTDVLSFSATQKALAPRTASITLENVGGGSLGVASIACQAPWCTVGGPPASIAGGSAASVPITVDPSAVIPGFYRTTVEIATSAGKGSVPVLLFVSQDSSMTLAPAGGQFSMPVGGAPGNPSGSFLVSVNTASPVNLTVAPLSGAPWLKVGTSTLGASAAQPGTVSYSIDPSVAGQLAAGAYYGQISVAGAGLVNSPLFFSIILNVTPASDSPKPDPQAAGLLFLATAGGANPPQQTVTVYTSAGKATQFQASASSDAGWLVVSPTAGSTSQPSPAATAIAANVSGLKPGIYSGLVSYAFGGSGVRSVNVTLVVSPAAGQALSNALPNSSSSLQPRADCAPSVLASVQTGLVSNFSAPTAWPTPLALKVVDNCGGIVTNAQIVTTFTNGDPPLALQLVDPTSGLYSATWTPRKAVANLTINARISAVGFKDLSMQLVGKVTPNAAPLLTPHGTVHAFSPLLGAPLAPGNIAAIYGANLAVITDVPATLPLPTDVNGTQVLIGGIKAPIYFTSTGQVNAQIPYELEPNKQYQVIVAANGALSTPDSIQVSAVVPGLAAYSDGTVIAQHADGSLINANSPAKGGETAVAYLGGLGSTTGDVVTGGASPGGDLALPTVTPTLTVGGVSAKIDFVGLTPGLVGLYQMNFEVPTGLTSGDAEIIVTQNGTASSPVLLPYTP